MNILICNERLLPRFGVDRILLLIGGGLIKAGHSVTFVYLRGDSVAIERVSKNHREVDVGRTLNLQETEAACRVYLETNWNYFFDSGHPEVVISGGWPFFCLALLAEQQKVASAFIDAGAVPQDGMSVGQVEGQWELRRTRSFALPLFSAVWPISNFISETQTLPERGSNRGVEVIHLGADHLRTPAFDDGGQGESDESVLEKCDSAITEGKRLLLLLGRYEPRGYKDSQAGFLILEKLLERGFVTTLLILARASDVKVPSHLSDSVVCLGHISDSALQSVMRKCSVALSTSKWEGFNLPVAEMQALRRPALAFCIGAHPEIIAHPWLLCADIEEMVGKAAAILEGAPSSQSVKTPFYDRFDRRFSWDQAITHYVKATEGIKISKETPLHDQESVDRKPIIVIDCTNSAVDPANPGVIRVARRLSREMSLRQEFLVLYARWNSDAACFLSLNRDEASCLATYDGPKDDLIALSHNTKIDEIISIVAGKDRILLLPEVGLDGYAPERVLWARARGFRVAAILHDLIPISHSPFCARDVVEAFPEYLRAIATVDEIYANSRNTLDSLEVYARRNGLALPDRRAVVWLPGQFSASPRIMQPKKLTSPLTALCISSIEPRKNHKSLILGFRLLRQRRPDLGLKLVLVGHRFGGSEHLASWVSAQVALDQNLEWQGLATDAEIATLFNEVAFTIYPSMVEGFGLPILESLWMGRPCVCHNSGVMSELARGGGCLMVDMADPEKIAEGLEQLATNTALRDLLSLQALERKIGDWRSYAQEIAGLLLRRTNSSFDFKPSQPVEAARKPFDKSVRKELIDQIDLQQTLNLSVE